MALLKSFACPADLTTRHSPSADTLRLVLRSVVHSEFDFERQNSTSLKDALRLCRSALASGDAREAELLWAYLCELAAQLCPNEGSLTRVGLVDRLRAHFSLRALPHYEPDWSRLREATRTELASIRDTVGESLRLPRDSELAKLAGLGGRFVALHGEPGVGKTVVAKWWFEGLPASVRFWWLNAGALDTSSFAEFVQALGLRNNLPDLLGATPDAQAWLVVDGLDAAYHPRVFRNLSHLFLSLPECWHVLLTCQTEHWERIRSALEQANAVANWSLIEVSIPAISDDVLGRFKNLQPLVQRPRLRSLITRPRYLDSLARRFEPSSFNRKWVGESDLLAWFWRTAVEAHPHGSARAEVAKGLAGRLGDSLRGTFLLTNSVSLNTSISIRSSPTTSAESAMSASISPTIASAIGRAKKDSISNAKPAFRSFVPRCWARANFQMRWPHLPAMQLIAFRSNSARAVMCSSGEATEATIHRRGRAGRLRRCTRDLRAPCLMVTRSGR